MDIAEQVPWSVTFIFRPVAILEPFTLEVLQPIHTLDWGTRARSLFGALTTMLHHTVIGAIGMMAIRAAMLGIPLTSMVVLGDM